MSPRGRHGMNVKAAERGQPLALARDIFLGQNLIVAAPHALIFDSDLILGGVMDNSRVRDVSNPVVIQKDAERQGIVGAVHGQRLVIPLRAIAHVPRQNSEVCVKRLVGRIDMKRTAILGIVKTTQPDFRMFLHEFDRIHVVAFTHFGVIVKVNDVFPARFPKCTVVSLYVSQPRALVDDSDSMVVGVVRNLRRIAHDQFPGDRRMQVDRIHEPLKFGIALDLAGN